MELAIESAITPPTNSNSPTRTNKADRPIHLVTVRVASRPTRCIVSAVLAQRVADRQLWVIPTNVGCLGKRQRLSLERGHFEVVETAIAQEQDEAPNAFSLVVHDSPFHGK